MKKFILNATAIALLMIPVAVVALAVVVIDSLTYGTPPGLFKNDVWQFIRGLWAS